jgi:GcrA cell cycle regulator
MHANTPLRCREHDRAARSKDRNRNHREGTNMTTHATTWTGATRAAETWTSERVEQLKGCIGAGLTCSQIAAEIGVTRNAVIGKLNRLGLARPKTMLAREQRQKRAAWRSKGGTGNVTRLFTQHRILVELPPEPPAGTEVTFIHNGRGCSLLELSPGNCRWPISEPGAADFCFCGNSQVEGLPYCAGHARLAYKSAARARR